MDRLWYHQIILFSKPTKLLLATKQVEKHVTISESSSSSSSSILSLQPLVDEETSTDESSLSSQKQVSSSESIISLPLQDCSIDNKEEINEILGKMSLLSCSQSSCSSLPPTGKHRKKSKKQGKLQKSMSFRPFGELELDEVKGFMDLGFQFKKEYISPRMISVVPGLQRLCLLQSESQLMDDGTENDDDIVEVYDEEEKRDIMRPYLSEAWLIKRPDSPLLNLKVPKTCSADNMKKHLRFWAKIVASEIKQE
ncbi:hypothetical protein P8452_67158 [Trifolium repens]|nr:hypothetical protein P8452_67158 [Trifolium repens]